MKKPIIVALILGLLAALLVRGHISQLEDQVRKGAELKEVVVAARDIPKLNLLDETMVRKELVPERFIQPGAIKDTSDVEGLVASVPIAKGQQILGTQIEAPSKETGLAIKVPTEKRAISVEVDEVIGVAGLIKPGDYVDLIGTFTVQGQQEKMEESQISATLLQKILVLAVQKDMGEVAAAKKLEKKGGMFGDGEEGMMGGGREKETITLAVTPYQAQMITLAEEMGKIRLTLRSPWEEVDMVALEEVTASTLLMLKREYKVQKESKWRDIKGTTIEHGR